jgi:hypothetical protein
MNGDNGFLPDGDTMGMAEEIADVEKLIREMSNEPASPDELTDEVDFVDFEED